MKNFALIACMAGTLLAGCSGDNKTENAVKRIQDRKKPGYSRVVNLTSDELSLWYKNRPVVTSIPTMTAAELLPLGVGEQTLQIKTGEKTQEQKVNLVSDTGTTVVVMPDRTTKMVENEPRYATDDANVHVVPIDAGGKVPDSVKFSGAENKSIPAKDSLVMLSQGNINCPDGSTIEIKERIAYSLFIVATPKKVYYILGKNASDRKPLVGAAGST